MMTPFLDYKHGLKLINVPHAKEVADEVLIDDVYDLSSIPFGCRIIDIGGFYGEFSLACAAKGFYVDAYEPAEESVTVFDINRKVNDHLVGSVCIHEAAVSDFDGEIGFNYNFNHPAGSKISGDEEELEKVFCVDINQIVKGLCAVKIDCEGNEYALFNRLGWLDNVKWLAMEFHNHDGDHFAKILEKKGFSVDLYACGPRNKTPWDKSMSAGLLHALK